jgi:small subunit ribosomal protein S9
VTEPTDTADTAEPKVDSVTDAVSGTDDVTVDDAPTDVTPESAVTEGVESDEFTDEPAPAVVPRTPIRVVVDRPIQTVGRRKEAVVRVRLTSGTGVFTLNGRTLDSYFPNKVHQQLIKEPLVTLDKAESFDISATLVGGGITGQAGALRLAIARALIDLDVNDRPPLKKAGFLSRDARVKERKKYGLKKARKAPQYSKR